MLMVHGLNFLSQALLSHLDQSELEREERAEVERRQKLMMWVEEKKVTT